MTSVQRDMVGLDATHAALNGVETLSLLNTVKTEELTQTLLTLNLVREVGYSGWSTSRCFTVRRSPPCPTSPPCTRPS